jgi:hypothetical protein
LNVRGVKPRAFNIATLGKLRAAVLLREKGVLLPIWAKIRQVEFSWGKFTSFAENRPKIMGLLVQITKVFFLSTPSYICGKNIRHIHQEIKNPRGGEKFAQFIFSLTGSHPSP